MKFHELTAAAIRNIDRGNTVAVIPIAAVEQHGPHMPTGTDTILVTGVAEGLERAMSDRVLLTPTLWCGASAHHLRFGATLDVELQGYEGLLCDLCLSLLEDGFLRILLLNGHGGNVDPLRMALRMIQPDFPDSLLVGGSYWSVADTEIRNILEGDHKFVGHACEFETSMMLHLRPDLVNRALLKDAGNLVSDVLDGMFVSRDMRQRTNEGYTGRPDLANEEKGKRLCNALNQNLIGLVEKMLQQPLGTTFEEFQAG